MSFIFPEEESLLKNIPEIIDGNGKKMLYVGASQWRAYLYDNFIIYGYKIDILEIFEPNVLFLREKGFNVIQGDVCKLDSFIKDNYDVIFWWHGPEHIEKDKLEYTLSRLELFGNLIILGCPSDEVSLQEEVYGNIYEKHLWNPQQSDFEKFGFNTSRIQRTPYSDHITAWRKK